MTTSRVRKPRLPGDKVGGGRPRKKPEDQRTHRHEFWLTDAEHEAFMSRAKLLGFRPGALIRHYIETGNDRILAVPTVNRAALADLARLGNVLVGLLKDGERHDETALIQDTLAQVKALRLDLVGRQGGPGNES